MNSYSSGIGIASGNRRSSYASVVSGSITGPPPGWSGSPPNLGNATPSSSYPPPYNPSSRLHRRPSVLDTEMQTNGGGNFGAGWRRSNPLPVYSRRFIKSQELGGGLGQHSTSQSFTPSYLRSSRYVTQLATALKSKMAQKESTSVPSSAAPSLSTSSSNVNLHRMAPSHRGMTYDIIEHTPPTEEAPLSPLPSRWNESDKFGGLDLLGDGLEVRYMGPINKHEHEAASVRADHPMPPQCGIYYYEVTILSKPTDGMIGVGFSSKKASLERLPGWEQESWAYHGDDGKTFFGDNQGQGKPYGPTFGVGDTIGCGLNFSTGHAFFTRDGVFLGNAFRDLKNLTVYPSVGMKKYSSCHIRANFGQFPFVYDIDGMMAEEKFNVKSDIKTTDVSNIHPPLKETALLQELVAQFLAHDGYVETARAFAEEVREEAKFLQNGRGTPLKGYQVEDDVDAVHRQKIRAAILDGDIDKALKLTNAYYANVFQDNPQIYFRLRCRKFIEMMRRCTESELMQPPKRTKASNGSTHDSAGDVFTHDMELDDSMQDVIGAEDMDMEESDNGMKYQTLLHEAIAYGQQLQADYPGVEKKEYKRTLDDIFSLVAYPDPKSSVHGHLLDPIGRVPVAEELNAAILVSLGKSSSAALERLYQQTEVLVNEISEDGGAGAFINVRNDFLV